MCKQIAASLIVGISLLVSGCGDQNPQVSLLELSDVTHQFLPADATKVLRAEGLPWEQIDFEVSRSGSDFAFPSSLIEKASSAGWAVCKPATPEWTTFEDATVSPRQRVEQKVYILHKDGVLVTLIGIYRQNINEQGLGVDSAPDTRRQAGVLVARHASPSESIEMAKSYQLSCD